MSWNARGLPACIAPLVLLGIASPAAGQILRVQELTAPEIGALDRATTVILLPGGILEEHGPYLPTYSDGYWNERLTTDIARAVAARPGWKAVVFPVIPLGNSGANDIGARFSFPGTYTVRAETLRSVYMDLAAELGEQGFRWVIVVHGHGAPNHSRALDQAGDFFRDSYGGHMVHVMGLMPVIAGWVGEKTEEEEAEDGLSIHSGMDETSWMLFLEPRRVRRGYRSAMPLAGSDMEALVELARQVGWPGYFGSPRLASRRHGERIWRAVSTQAVRLSLEILDGLDERTIPRFAEEMANSPEDVRLDAASSAREEGMKRRQMTWLAAHGLR